MSAMSAYATLRLPAVSPSRMRPLKIIHSALRTRDHQEADERTSLAQQRDAPARSPRRSHCCSPRPARGCREAPAGEAPAVWPIGPRSVATGSFPCPASAAANGDASVSERERPDSSALATRSMEVRARPFTPEMRSSARGCSARHFHALARDRGSPWPHISSARRRPNPRSAIPACSRLTRASVLTVTTTSRSAASSLYFCAQT